MCGAAKSAAAAAPAQWADTPLAKGQYAKELETACLAVQLASKLCRTVQQQLKSSETAGKQDDSPVTVADYGAYHSSTATAVCHGICPLSGFCSRMHVHRHIAYHAYHQWGHEHQSPRRCLWRQQQLACSSDGWLPHCCWGGASAPVGQYLVVPAAALVMCVPVCACWCWVCRCAGAGGVGAAAG